MTGPARADREESERRRFERLLEFLGRDGGDAGLTPEELAEQRGLRYEEVRRKLVRLFTWRGSVTPEVLADRTFDRLMGKLDSLNPDEFENPTAYVLAVGRNIFFEDRRARPPARMPPATEDPEDKERAARCLDQCMEKLLEPRERTLILDYYRGEKKTKIESRLAIAVRHNLSVNALRIECYRIRRRLRKCVSDCVGLMK